ncbi:MAG: 30S ribosomal protein S8 [Patescibacteria group bacterium]
MYSVADFVIRVKNASDARRREVVMPYSKITKAIGKLLVKEGFLADIRETEFDGKKTITAGIRYVRRKPVVEAVEIVSKPSLRFHINHKELQTEQRKKTLTLVVSTSQGLMTGKDALKKGLGGELLFKIG